jgi:hypothetical protein
MVDALVRGNLDNLEVVIYRNLPALCVREGASLMLNAVVEIVVNTTRTSGVPETNIVWFAYQSERYDKMVSSFRIVLASAFCCTNLHALR